VLHKLEEQILLAVLKLGPDATAGDVRAALSEANKRKQAFGAVFTALERLTEKKFVKWKKGSSEARRGGRAPRLYSITALGRTTLISSLRATQALAAGSGIGVTVLMTRSRGAR
jgi:PadR family transcriptional regulator, regulatory protein PadR